MPQMEDEDKTGSELELGKTHDLPPASRNQEDENEMEDENDYQEIPASISRGSRVCCTRLEARKQHQQLAVQVNMTATEEPVYLEDIDGLVRTLLPLSAGTRAWILTFEDTTAGETLAIEKIHALLF